MSRPLVLPGHSLGRRPRSGAPAPRRGLTRRGQRVLLEWLLLASAAFALWDFWPERSPTPPLPVSARANWDGFQALLYRGVRRDGAAGVVPPDRFLEHLEALRGAGYRPISIEEAHRFLLRRDPLPERAVLLVLEDGRRETAFSAEPALLAVRAPALFLLRPEAVERRSRSAPAPHELRSLLATGRWSFAEPAADASEMDSSEVDASEMDATVVDAPETAPEPRAGLERRGARRLGVGFLGPCPLHFASRGYSFNASGRAPEEATGLEVDPAWSGEELLAWLNAQGPRRGPGAGPVASTGEADWVIRHGGISFSGDRILLEAVDGRGAEAWLAGTEAWRSVRGSMLLDLRSDRQSWLYLRGQPGRSFLRLGWSGRKVLLQERTDGGVPSTLSEGQAPEGAATAEISFELLERRIRFAVKGGRSPERSIAFSRALEAGMAGIGSWALEEGAPGTVAIEALRLTPFASSAQVVRGVEDLQASGVETPGVAAPLWYEAPNEAAGAGGTLLAGASDPALIHLAAYRGASLWPIVRLLQSPDPKALEALGRQIGRAAREPGVEGIIIDPRPARDAGAPIELGALAAIVEASGAAIGVVLERAPAEFLQRLTVEKLAWIVIPQDPNLPAGDPAFAPGGRLAPAEIPPERILRILEPSAP